MSKYFLIVFVNGCFLFLWSTSTAQPTDSDSFDQTQIITGDRNLSVQKAFKISSQPSPVEISIVDENFDYQIVPMRPAIQLEVEPIEPAKIKVRKPLEKLYSGFVKGGVGTFATPYLDAFYTSTRKRDLSYGAWIRHLSSNDGINREVAFSGFSENSANVWAKKIFKEHSIQGDLGFSRNVVHYYGFDPEFYDFNIEKKDYRQRFNEFTIGSNWRSYYRDSSRVNHKIDFDFYVLDDLYDSQELGFDVDAKLESFRGNQYYTLETGLDFISYNSGELRAFSFMNDSAGLVLDGATNSNAIFKAIPRILLTHKGLRAMVGIGIYGQFSNQAKFHAFPDIEVSYSLFDDIFIPYAGITGSVQRNSYRSITATNPFVLSNVELINSVEKYRFFAGIRGSISSNLSFNTGFNLSQVDDLPLFVNDTLFSVENRLSIIYDRVNNFELFGQLTYQSKDKWNANLMASFNSYSTKNELEAWHLPSFEIRLNGNYNLFNKFIIGAELAWIGKRNVKSLFPVSGQDAQLEGFTSISLDPYLDLSLKAEYRYTRRLTVFVEGNNLTASKYDIFYRFPSQRVFILGGLKYAF